MRARNTKDAVMRVCGQGSCPHEPFFRITWRPYNFIMQISLLRSDAWGHASGRPHLRTRTKAEGRPHLTYGHEPKRRATSLI